MSIKLGILASSIQSGGGTDPDAQAFFNRVTAAGGTLSATEQNAVNTLTLSLKSFGIWPTLKALYPIVGGSAASCAQNLISSSFTGTFGGGWIFSTTGIQGNASNTFMDTALSPSISLTLSSGQISVYIRSIALEDRCDIGTTNGAFGAVDEILLMSNFPSLGFVPVYTQYGGGGTNFDARGFFITNRNSATITNGFKNGVKIYNAAQTASILPVLPFTLGCQNATSKTRFTTKEYAFCSIGDGITDVQASNFYTVVQTFQTTLSRQV